MTTDSIADLLTRIRNAGLARHRSVVVPLTKMSLRILQILDSENYIDSFMEYTEKEPQKTEEGTYRLVFRSVLQKKVNSKNLFFCGTQCSKGEAKLSAYPLDGDNLRCLFPPCISVNSLNGGLLVFLSYVRVESRGRKFPLIEELTRISKASRPVYWKFKKMPRIQGGFGLAILSTTLGLLTDVQARANHIGGEVLFSITKRNERDKIFE